MYQHKDHHMSAIIKQQTNTKTPTFHAVSHADEGRGHSGRLRNDAYVGDGDGNGLHVCACMVSERLLMDDVASREEGGR
jgi:hypothetical protein